MRWMFEMIEQGRSVQTGKSTARKIYSIYAVLTPRVWRTSSCTHVSSPCFVGPTLELGLFYRTLRNGSI